MALNTFMNLPFKYEPLHDYLEKWPVADIGLHIAPQTYVRLASSMTEAYVSVWFYDVRLLTLWDNGSVYIDTADANGSIYRNDSTLERVNAAIKPNGFRVVVHEGTWKLEDMETGDYQLFVDCITIGRDHYVLYPDGYEDDQIKLRKET